MSAWLAAFENALSGEDPAVLAATFHPEGYWRDVLAFTWRITTVRGAQAVASRLCAEAGRVRATGFEIARDRTPPRCVKRAGVALIEAIFTFETAQGRGDGIVTLIPGPDREGAGRLRAWTLLSALEELTGFEERVGSARPTGEGYSRDFHGPNWLDLRHADAAYENRDPAVLVVGGGHAGLSIAARLTQLGVDTLIVDRHDRIGDNWLMDRDVRYVPVTSSWRPG